jgi:hypothetical protein
MCVNVCPNVCCAVAAKGVKNVTLELGGKSPAIVFDSCDVERAVEWAMFGCFWTNGQICSATSRLLLQRNIYDKFLDRLVQETDKIKVREGTGEEIGGAEKEGGREGSRVGASVRVLKVVRRDAHVRVGCVICVCWMCVCGCRWAVRWRMASRWALSSASHSTTG